jgi:hypothetical protein
VTVDGLTNMAPPDPLTSCQVTAVAHPRVWLTPARLAAAAARGGSDLAAQRFQAGVDYFLAADTPGTDVNSTAFSDQVYDPESYIPALGLCYQLAKTSDATRATQCAQAARDLAVKIATDYDTGVRDFGRDTGYDIRFGLMQIMIAYDWIYDFSGFSSADKTLIVKIGNEWLDWYKTPGNGYASTHPYENYYAGYLQGLTVTALATAGDNTRTDEWLELLWQKMFWEMPILDERLCGGDWPEGWNYGPYSVEELALVDLTLRDFGEDWQADFDWLDEEGQWLTYQMSPDFDVLFSFGGYSGSVPDKTSPALLAVLSSGTRAAGLAQRLYTNVVSNPNSDAFDGTRGFTAFEMIYDDPTQTYDPGALPKSYLASGTGRWWSKSSLTDAAAYSVAGEGMSYFYDHYGYANGDVRLYKGSTCIVCPSAYATAAPGNNFNGEEATTAFSTYRVDDQDQNDATRNNQILYAKDGGDYAAVGMRIESSFDGGHYDESLIVGSNPLDYLTREIVHVRPGLLVVRDLHRRRDSSTALEARFHFGSTASATPAGTNAWTLGPISVTVYTGAAVNVSYTPDLDGSGAQWGTLMTIGFPADTAPEEMVTVITDDASSLSATSYAAGELHLSDGRCVRFSNGSADVGGCQ